MSVLSMVFGHSASTRKRLDAGIRVVYILLLSGGLFVVGIRTPKHNWDMIGYVASIFESMGYHGGELSDKTFEDVRRAVPDSVFFDLTGGDPAHYREPVYRDPVAMEQQLPFYRIRYLYVYAARAISAATGSMSQATVAVSALSTAAIAIVLGVHLWHYGSLFFIVLPVVTISSGLLRLAGLSTPDTLAALMALTAILNYHKHRYVSLVILVLIPLARTDFIILSGIMLIYRAYSGGRMREYILFAASFGMFWLANCLAGNYGYLTIVNFTFIHDPPFVPYPADMVISHHVGDYVKAYVKGVVHFVGNPFMIVYLLTTLCLIHRRRATRRFIDENYCALISIAFVFTHFALFPYAQARFYLFANLLLSVYLVNHFTHQESRCPIE